MALPISFVRWFTVPTSILALIATAESAHAQQLKFGNSAQTASTMSTSGQSMTGAELVSKLSPDERIRAAADFAENGANLDEVSEVRFTPVKRSAGGTGVLVEDPSEKVESAHLIYAGFRLGLPFLLGVTLTDIHTDHKGQSDYLLETEAATFFLATTFNVGAAKFFGPGRHMYLGGRAHVFHVLDIFDSSEGVAYGAGPEFGYVRNLGSTDRAMFSLRVGSFFVVNRDIEVAPLSEAKVGFAFRLGSDKKP